MCAPAMMPPLMQAPTRPPRVTPRPIAPPGNYPRSYTPPTVPRQYIPARTVAPSTVPTVSRHKQAARSLHTPDEADHPTLLRYISRQPLNGIESSTAPHR